MPYEYRGSGEDDLTPDGKPGRPRLPREHGTVRGWGQHWYNHETPCRRCMDARNDRDTERRQRRGQSPAGA